MEHLLNGRTEHGKLLLLIITHEVSQSQSESRSVVSDSLRPHGLYSLEFSRPEYWSGQPFPSPGDLPNPGIEPRSPTLQVDSLPAEPQGKPKNIGVGSLSFLQQIFLTQESNRGLLHCRLILYQLTYQGSLGIIPSIAIAMRVSRSNTQVSGVCKYFLTHTSLSQNCMCVRRSV